MTNKERILLVEDEDSLAIGLEFNLSAEGYSVSWVNDGKKALQQIHSARFDLVILDLMLPYVSGFEVAEKIRTNDPQLPILILTARTALKDRLKGFEIGADDYLTKPFHLEELLLRVKGMLKRKKWYRQSVQNMPTFQLGEKKINFEALTILSKNQKLQLTTFEAILLKYLIDNRGKVVSRKELLEKVWNISSEIETRTVDNFIVRLRKYLEPDPDNPIYIKSIRGVGYLLNGK